VIVGGMTQSLLPRHHPPQPLHRAGRRRRHQRPDRIGQRRSPVAQGLRDHRPLRPHRPAPRTPAQARPKHHPLEPAACPGRPRHRHHPPRLATRPRCASTAHHRRRPTHHQPMRLTAPGPWWNTHPNPGIHGDTPSTSTTPEVAGKPDPAVTERGIALAQQLLHRRTDQTALTTTSSSWSPVA